MGAATPLTVENPDGVFVDVEDRPSVRFARGPLTLTGTNVAAAPVLAGNTVNGPLSCTGNTPAPVNNGQPNTVRGPATGQCRGL